MENKLLCQLYETYASELSLYLYSMCRDRDLAADLLQEVFLKAMLSLSPEHTNFRAWLYKVARNLCFNESRRRKREVVAEPPEGEATWASGGNDAAPPEPLVEILARERNQQLYQGILQLSPVASQVILLQYFGGLSQSEIAQVLDISPGNVRVIACRAKNQLRKHMEGYEDELRGNHSQI